MPTLTITNPMLSNSGLTLYNPTFQVHLAKHKPEKELLAGEHLKQSSSSAQGPMTRLWTLSANASATSDSRSLIARDRGRHTQNVGIVREQKSKLEAQLHYIESRLEQARARGGVPWR